METSEVVSVLGALAQETRLDIYRLLVRAGPEGLAAGEIARRLEVPAPTLSFHLRTLTQAGLLSVRRVGRSLLYAPDFPAFQRVLQFLTDDCCSEPAPRRGARRRPSR